MRHQCTWIHKQTMVYIEEYERRKSIYRYSDRNIDTYIMDKFAEILLSLTQPTTAAGAYIDNQFNWTSFFGWLLELGLVLVAFIYAVMDYPLDGDNTASTTTIFILIRLCVVAISVALNLFKVVLSNDMGWRSVFSMVETASAVLPVVGLSMMEASNSGACNNNQWIIHSFLIGSLAVRLIRTFAVLDWCNKSVYNKLDDGLPIETDSDERWRQRKANYASIRSKAREEVTYNFQSSGVQRHDLI